MKKLNTNFTLLLMTAFLSTMIFLCFKASEQRDLKDPTLKILADPLESQKIIWEEHEIWANSKIECYNTVQ